MFESNEQLLVVLADGAGGTRSGAVAAQAIVDAVEACHDSHDDWSAVLCELDLDTMRLGNGQSTAVIVAIRDGLISGASVGDSCAWLIHDAEVVDLTEGQARKPFVGGGGLPFPVEPTRLDAGTLLIASDGLWRYAKRRDIAAVANGADLSAAVQALVDLVRLPTGGLQDDVAVVLCRSLVDGDRR